MEPRNPQPEGRPARPSAVPAASVLEEHVAGVSTCPPPPVASDGDSRGGLSPAASWAAWFYLVASTGS